MRFLSASDPYHGLTSGQVSSLTTSILIVRESRVVDGARDRNARPKVANTAILERGTEAKWGTHLLFHFSHLTLPADRTSKDIQ